MAESFDGESSHYDFSGNALAYPGFTTSSPFQPLYPLLSTPLTLPRDWPDSYYSPSADPFSETYSDFQSNHLGNSKTNLETASPPSGLGIRNIELIKDSKDTEIEDCQISRADVWFGHQLLERRPTCHNHTCRKDSIYNMTEEEIVDRPATLGSPWAFSAILRAAELAGENASTERVSSVSSRLDLSDSTNPLASNSAKEATWSFESISASTGMSVAEFAAQVSATAEETLRRMSGDKFISDNPAYDPGRFQMLDDYNDADQTSTWMPMLIRSPPLPLALADINMRDLESSWNSACVGVNPADIYSVPLPGLKPRPERLFLVHPDQVALARKDVVIQCSSDNQAGAPDLGTQTDSIAQVPDLDSPYEGPVNLPLLRSKLENAEQASDDEPSIFQSPSSSEYSPPLKPMRMKRNQSSRISTRRTARKSEDPDDYTEYQDTDQYNLLPLNLGTPVFDAHRGINIEELKAKAERYRLRNQGRDYDKRWLISFAGKLSAKGELVEEFRCYISGCKQNNKRRDHILIHVGAHLDQRPFKCMHWYVPCFCSILQNIFSQIRLP